MQLGRFRIGMRTFKSALAVFICILIFQIFDRGAPMIAALSAVFSLRQDLTATFTFGRSRVIGNFLGGLTAIVYVLLSILFHHNFAVELIGLPILVAFVIITSDGINNNAGLISAVATLLMITFTVPESDSLTYTFQRVFDTFIGTVVAIGVNSLIRPPKKEEIAELEEDIDLLRQKERDLQAELTAIQQQIKEQNK